MLPRIALTAFAASALASTGAIAAPLDGGAGFTLEMTGHVPLICHAEVQNNIATPQDGVVSLGTLSEFCNDLNGYEVYAEHSAELADAVLVVDGVPVPLSAEGPTRVSRSDHANIATRSVELRL